MQPSDKIEYTSLLEEDATIRQDDHPTNSGGLFIEKRTAWLICILLVLNIMLSISNATEAARTAKLLRSCEKKDVRDLPRPDPFIGLSSMQGYAA